MRAILTWHSLDDSGSPISVAPARFRQQLEWIGAAGLRVVSVDELLTLGDDAQAVALTFDDGIANFATVAAPLLAARGWPVTMFVVSGRVGIDNSWSGETPGIPVLPLLDWAALRELAGAGVRMENHTRSHPHLDRLTAAESVAEVEGGARALRERLGAPVTGIAYPYGAFDARTLEAARRSHRWGVTTEFRALRAGDDPLALPRLDAWYFRRRSHFTSWGSARFRTWVWARRSARAVRSSVRGAR